MKPPFYNLAAWGRVILKGLALLIIFNVLFIFVKPMDVILPLSVYGRLMPYRTRLIPAENDASVQLASLETLVNAHEIAQNKATDEYRVVVLGDSGIYGWGNAESETISSQLTAMNIILNHKKLRAYNLAAPFLSTTRDLLIADAVNGFQPDLVIWFVTLQGFRNDDHNFLIELNQERMTRLTLRFGLTDQNAQSYGHYAGTVFDRSLLNQRQAIYHWLKFQTYVFQPDKPNPIDHLAINDSLIRNPPSPENSPQYMPMPGPAWSPLVDMQPLMNVPVLLINEPILIVPSAPLNYDSYYGIALYDRYRAVFNSFCTDQKLWCLDLWNLLPSSDYTDTPLHHTAIGNRKIAEQLMTRLLEPTF